jgi:hypothetical protein
MTCRARRELDEWFCAPCRLRWGADEPVPAACRAGCGELDVPEFLREPVYPFSRDHDDEPPQYLPPMRLIKVEKPRSHWDDTERRPLALLVRRPRPDVHAMRQPALLTLRLPGGLSAGPWPDTPRGRGELWDWALRLRLAPL